MIIAKESFQPQIRADIVFGPPELSGGKTIYYIKDKVTNWFYRIGAKEHFLISRMDGRRTIWEIGEEYSKAFEGHLDDQAWQKLFDLLEKRQLLTNTANSVQLIELQKAAERKKQADNKKLFRRRFKLVNPDRFLGKILPWFRFMFHPVLVITMLLMVVAIEIGVVLNREAIGASVWRSYTHPFVFALFLVLFWLFTALHEIAHGLACKRFGGTVTEIGILWRYLSFFPYCKLDDVVLFHNRRHRVYTAFAGIFINLVLLLPFGVLWWLAPANSELKELSGLFLTIFNLSALVNIVPFIELDGYFMLSHALGLIDLRKESQRFWLRLVSRLVLKKGEGVQRYAAREHYVYCVYGLLSLLVTTTFLVGISLYWFMTVQEYVGPIVAWGAFITLGLCLLYRKVSQRRGKNLIGQEA